MSTGKIGDAVAAAVQGGWIQTPMIPTLYASSGTDTKAITFTHPEFLARQIGREVEPPKFFAYVDRDVDLERTTLDYDDGKTSISTVECREFCVHQLQGELVRLRMRSQDLDGGPAADLRGDIAVLRVRADNEAFTQAAISERWSPLCFIGVCDGCGAFGGNDRCENQMEDPDASIPWRLRTPWWITDHLPGSRLSGGDDPKNGEEIQPLNEESPMRLRQLAFLNTMWRSRVSNEIRLYGGSRLFELVLPKSSASRRPAPADFMLRNILYSPRANRKLR